MIYAKIWVTVSVNNEDSTPFLFFPPPLSVFDSLMALPIPFVLSIIAT